MHHILNRYGFGTYRDFYLWYELYYSTKDDILEIVREDQTPLPLKVLNIDNTTPALLINNTVIFVLEKQKGTNEGITPEDVFHKICQIISTITNCPSLILSLSLKLIIHEKLAILGKGLGGLNEEALVYHANSYNDKTNEGLSYKGKNIFTVQFHPEACAGPQDTAYLFDRFMDMMKKED